MATMLLDALKNQGTHNVSEINSIWAKPVVNGAILTGGNLDNGLLVSLDGYDEEGNLKCKAYTGTGDMFVVQTHVEEQLQTDLGEYDYKNFYNAEGEIVRLIRVEKGLRQETSAFVKDVALSALTLGKPVSYDESAKQFKVLNEVASEIQIATLVGIDTDFGYNAGKETIRIEYI